MKKEAYIKASSHFLTEQFPDNFDEMDEEEILKFINEHRWQPFENKFADEVWGNIEVLAEDFINFAKNFVDSRKN